MESKINKITQALSAEDIEHVFAIRTEVFVHEQKCLPSEEFDALDAVANHFLFYEAGVPVATGRYRKTDKGIKVERIATLQAARNKGYARAILKHILADARTNYPSNQYFYLHAQVVAMPVYASIGFKPFGETFIEADIVHQAMELHVHL